MPDTPHADTPQPPAPLITPAADDGSQHVRLRRATAADAAALALVGGATFLEAFPWMLPGADIVAHCARHHTAEAYTRYLAQPGTAVVLAEAAPGGAPVGYAMLAAPELPSFEVQPEDIELKRIYIFSRFRRSPVDGGAEGRTPAQAMLDWSVESARTSGKRRLLLGTHAENRRAIGFYERNGFRPAGTRVFQVGSQQCCDLIFAKSLLPA